MLREELEGRGFESAVELRSRGRFGETSMTSAMPLVDARADADEDASR